MIDTSGMITVAEAAKRLDLSIEQVRRKLREGKLRGQRIGNPWFVEESSLEEESEEAPLFSSDFVEEILELRKEINARRRNLRQPAFDVVEMLHELREEAS